LEAAQYSAVKMNAHGTAGRHSLQIITIARRDLTIG